MPDDANAMELAEIDVERLIKVCHKSLNYWEILRIFLTACQKLQMLADCEYQMKQS